MFIKVDGLRETFSQLRVIHI